MKKLEDFADDINKCSKCGLCQSVCPVYKITGNDCAVSRGKFVMLDGVLKGDLKLNKNIEKYLDMCLKCGKCKNFCPSNIDVCEIFNTAKYECAKNTFHGKFEKFFESKLVFGTFMKFMKIFRRINSAASISGNRGEGCIKLLYFKGCVNNVYPKTERALKKIFSNLNVEIIERDFDCCGLPFLSSGNMERFEEVKKYNLALVDSDFDYILTDCASCESTLKGYFNSTHAPLTTEDKKASFERAVARSDGGFSFVNAAEFLAGQNIKFKFKKPVKVTFHKPCHLENDDFLKPLLQKCENVEYIEAEDYDECCGFAGEFAIKNHKISKNISVKKANNIAKTNADIVLTTCPACILGIKQGFLFSGKKSPKIMNIMEFLADSQIIV
ncbi:(Fe-S)-binding protein [Spirochaetes bacterium]|uniref:(Fe-S)-binding protein n=1 Tax=Candidatus Scatousia excrementipullorum TaxID=2840936 RepID=A0A9D9DNJ4_9BACT|nr:(Fe-S)-binding protein [Candidatus Scatousia excrementipullorum]